MKRLLLLALLSVTISLAKAQDKTIILTEKGMPYTNQTWFYSGKDKALQEDKILTHFRFTRTITIHHLNQ